MEILIPWKRTGTSKTSAGDAGDVVLDVGDVVLGRRFYA